MTTSALSFPYPILGNADDMEGEFGWDVSVKLGREDVTITAILKLENQDLSRAIAKRDAVFAIQVQCPVTFYRETFVTEAQKAVLTLPAKGLRDNVELTPFIFSKSDVKRYSPRTAHKDYKGSTFGVQEGSVLAVGPKAFFIADKEFVGSKRRIRSIMEFVKHKREDADPEFRLSGDRIEIYLNSADWSVYQASKGSEHARNVIHASVVFPVLLEAIDCIEDEDYLGLPWRERLKVLIHEKGLEEAEPFIAAMALLKNPISRGFSGISGLLNPNETDDDEGDDE